jgi:hypothetical protein
MAKMKKGAVPVVNSADSTNERFAKALHERTCAWANRNGFTGKSKDTFCSEAKEWDSLIKRWNFGCQEGGVREIIEKMRGIKLPPVSKPGEDITFDVGVVVIPLSDPNGHGYLLGSPVLVYGTSGTAISTDGVRSTKSLPRDVRAKTALRPANLAEIEYLLDSLANRSDFGTLALEFVLSNFIK